MHKWVLRQRGSRVPCERAARGTTTLVLALCALVACASETGPAPDPSRYHEPVPAAHNAERPGFCARSRDDAVRDVFCGEAPPPTIRSLQDLQTALGLNPSAPIYDNALATPQVGPQNPYDLVVAVLGHSTALSGHLVSPINPRLIILGQATFMAFQRGVQKVEVIATERRENQAFNFYLFEFEQACNRRESGCVPADLYTPRLESDWLAVRVEDDEDIKNTPSDCRQCHQRAQDLPQLLMRELNSPWTHFFMPPVVDVRDEPGVLGGDLTVDYMRAKGDELYGGFAIQAVSAIAPMFLESTVLQNQPVLFDAPGIQEERWPYDVATGFPAAPKPSPTWHGAFEAFKLGEQLALPYFEPRVSDLEKQTRVSEAYARYRAGGLSDADFPDVADVFPDDPRVRAHIGLQTEPDASPVDALIQACGACHNDVLDQNISRARFNINLWRFDRAAIAVAIERLERSPNEPGVMPPPEARRLDPNTRARLLAYLRQDPLSNQPDARLVRASELGMAGGAERRSPGRRVR